MQNNLGNKIKQTISAVLILSFFWMLLVFLPHNYAESRVQYGQSQSLGVGVVGSTHILDGTILNEDVSSTAAIAYSKLLLTGLILNADISSTTEIVDTKLAVISTAGKVSGAALTSLASIPANAGVIPAANTQAVAFNKLGETILAQSSTTIVVAGLTARRNLEIFAFFGERSSHDTTDLQFNADTTSNYTGTVSLNGALNNNYTNNPSCNLAIVGLKTTSTLHMRIINTTSSPKIGYYDHGFATSSAVAGSYADGTCTWYNNTAQITQINFKFGVSSVASSSYVTVYGSSD